MGRHSVKSGGSKLSGVRDLHGVIRIDAKSMGFGLGVWLNRPTLAMHNFAPDAGRIGVQGVRHETQLNNVLDCI